MQSNSARRVGSNEVLGALAGPRNLTLARFSQKETLTALADNS